jgi:FAD/FMN-containing dehydrogenase
LRLERALPGRATALLAVPSWEAACSICMPSQSLGGAVISRAEVLSWNQLAVAAVDLGSGPVANFAESAWRALGMTGSLAEHCTDGSMSPVFVLLEFEAADHASADSALERFLTELAERAMVLDALMARNHAEAEHLWWVREQRVIERLYAKQQSHRFDIAAPLAELPGYVAHLYDSARQVASQLRVFVLGHLGDGNLHVNMFAAPALAAEAGAKLSRRISAPLAAMGGAFSAEHGIGLDKRDVLRKHGDPTKRRLMRELKALLDPANLLNPANVL